MLLEEIGNAVFGYHDRRYLDGLWLPSAAGLHRILDDPEHVVAFGERILPGGCRHVAFLDVLQRLGVAVDAIDLDVVATSLAKRRDRADRGIIPASPDRERFAAR